MTWTCGAGAGKLSALLLAALAGTAMHAAHAARPRLYLTAEASPPAVMVAHQRVTGSAAEKIRAIMDKAAIDYEIAVLPWRRAYALAQTQADTCVFSTTRTPEREAMFKWVGPTHANDWTLFGLAARDYHLGKLDDARLLHIGAYVGDVRADYLQQRGFIVDMVSDDMSNPRKLLAGRLDLWVSGENAGKVLIRQNGWVGQIVPVLTFRHTEQYLACNRQVPDALITKMNAALQALNREGVSAAIEKRFEFPPRQ
jgi:polar amino acid transport system substrate-binding protein